MTDFNDETLPDRRPLILRLVEKRAGIEAKNKFMPIKTLGTPKKGEKWYAESMAMDSCFRNVLSRSLNNQISYDAYSSFVGYGMLSNLTQEALIRAGVETIADDMTRKLPELYYNDDGYGKEDLINTINSEMARYKIKSIINDAMQKDGYFGGCLVYIDVGDLEDDEAEEPLVLDKKTFKTGSFRGLKVIEPVNIAAGDYNTTNPTNKNYFTPEWYYILGKRYHASRFLYIASNDAPLLLKPAYNFFGIPQAQLALDYVANYIANRESAQELLNKFSLTGFGTDLSQALQQDGSWADIINRIKAFNKFKTNNGTFVYNKETEELMQLNTPLGGVRDIVEMSMNCLTAVWRIPKVRYIGEGDGGLNASTDGQLRSYYDYILALQEKVLSTPYEKIIRILQLNKGLEPDDKLLFKFPYLWEMDEKERAELNKTQADRDAIYLANGVISQEEVRQRLSLDRYSGYTMIDVDDVPEPQEQPLENTDKEEQDEEDRQAMDMAIDGRWITIGAREKGENGEDDEGRKGCHIYLDDGETPEEAIKDLENKDDKKEEQKTKELSKEDNPKEENKEKSIMGYKSANKSIKDFVKLKEETDAAHKFLADTLEEYKNKLDELRKNSKEYQEAEYEYKHSKELAKERGVFEWNILRDASHKKSELDQYFSEEAYLSIKGANEARAKINEFYGGSDDWEKGVNEIQANIKENIARASKENQKLADAITAIENKIPEYKENLDSLWDVYKKETKDSDWASSTFKYGEYVEKAAGVKTKLIEEKEEFAKKVGKVLRSDDGQTIGLASSGIKGLEERLKSVFDGVMAKGILKDNEKPKVVKRNCRAHQSGETLTLCGDTDIQTAIHEFMHYVEYKNPVMLANSIAFLKYRTCDEKIHGLKKLTGISYGSGERARPDKFFNAYCGKVYSMTGDYIQATATEIMSMGVQELFTNPAKFRKEDPEYFNFVLANLKGTL